MRGNTAFGKITTGFKREYKIDENGNLDSKMYLGVEDNEPYHHLSASLSKTS